MAKIATASTVALEVTLALTESEARALEALTGYDVDGFLKSFYTSMGRHYLEPHESGLRSLFKSVRELIPSQLSRVDAARAVFNEKDKPSNPARE